MARAKGGPKGRCGQEGGCPSRRYHDDGEGRYVCENGHVQIGFTVQGEDEDDWDAAQRGTVHRAEKAKAEKVRHHLSGRQGFEHYLYCYQHLLRTQCWVLVKNKGLPPKLEQVVLSLWTLRLQNFVNRIPDPEAEDGEPEMFSSQPQSLVTTDSETDGTETGLRKDKLREKDASPTLLHTLGYCYLALLILKLPYTPGDIQKWASRNELHYYHVIKVVPRNMLRQLPSAYHESLTPHVLLQPGDVHSAAVDLAIRYKRDFGMNLPSLNRPLLTYRFIKDLALPLDIYPAVSRLAEFVEFEFKYPKTLIKTNFQPLDYPEYQHASLIIIATKLLYPFDTMKRYPTTAFEPAAIRMNWDVWNKAFADSNKTSLDTKPAQYEEMMNQSDQAGITMTAEEMDAYMDFYDENYVEMDVEDEHAAGGVKKKGDGYRRVIEGMFPKTPASGSISHSPRDRVEGTAHERDPASQRLANVITTMKPAKVVPEQIDQEEINRPGSHYTQYRTPEDLQGNAKVFYEEVARLAGLPLDKLLRAVISTEYAITRKRSKGRPRFGSGNKRSRSLRLEPDTKRGSGDDEEDIVDV